MRILIRMCHLFSYSEHTEGSTSPANCCCELQSIHHDCSCCQPVSSVSRAASQTHGSFGLLRVRGFQAPCQQVSMLTSVYTTPKLLFIHTALIILLTKFLTYCSFLIYVINSICSQQHAYLARTYDKSVICKKLLILHVQKHLKGVIIENMCHLYSFVIIMINNRRDDQIQNIECSLIIRGINSVCLMLTFLISILQDNNI